MNLDLKKRWQAEPARAFVETLARYGRSGNGYEIQDSPFGFMPETGRLDLRGLVLPERTELRRITFRSTDLTGAAFIRPWFELSRFENTCFDDASLPELGEKGSVFEKCTFRNTSLRRSHVGYNGSRFKDCRFEKTDFIQTGFIRPEFDDCCFDICTFSGVDFRAASFERCEFRGEVRGVWFHGEYQVPSVLEEFANPRPNRMSSVSFRNATLFDITFSDGCDLSSVTPPDDGRHALFDRWQERIRSVFERSRAWPDPCRRQGEIFYTSCVSHPNRDGTYPKEQNWYLIGVDELMNQHGKQPGMKIWQTLLSTLSD
jgi:fluoroquinolone resistance protein